MQTSNLDFVSFYSSKRKPLRDLADVHIVVVDDDPDARDLLHAALSQRGATVVVAATADEAYEALRRERPAVLVSDIAMPDVDGYMLVRRVRALPAEDGGRTPAIAVTAYAGTVDRNLALIAGFDRYLAKPVDIGRLVAEIRALVEPPSA